MSQTHAREIVPAHLRLSVLFVACVHQKNTHAPICRLAKCHRSRKCDEWLAVPAYLPVLNHAVFRPNHCVQRLLPVVTERPTPGRHPPLILSFFLNSTISPSLCLLNVRLARTSVSALKELSLFTSCNRFAHLWSCFISLSLSLSVTFCF